MSITYAHVNKSDLRASVLAQANLSGRRLMAWCLVSSVWCRRKEASSGVQRQGIGIDVKWSARTSA